MAKFWNLHQNPIQREYCKYMPNDTMIENWVTGKEDVSNADFPMVVDPIHKILYCELPKVGSSNWKRVLIKLTDPRYEDVKNVLGSVSFSISIMNSLKPSNISNEIPVMSLFKNSLFSHKKTKKI